MLLLVTHTAGFAWTSRPKLAVVIDDFGLTYKKNVPDEKWWRLPGKLTYAVMPESPRTKEAAQDAAKAGKEVIIHFPFDPFQSYDLAADHVTLADQKKALALLEKAMKQVPQAVGLNNHRSLNATANRPLMAWFMGELKARKLYFLDSRVGPQSVAYAEAKKAGIAATVNSIFLEEGKKRDKDFCERMLRQAATRAHKKGWAVAIGHHYFQGTYDCLAELLPKLQEEGIELVFASELARLPAEGIEPTRP